jgi:hypothetical protein
MADFSIGSAAGAGFRLIARKPLAVLAWGLLIWAVMLPVLLLFGSIFSLIAAGVQEAARQSADVPGATNAVSSAANAITDATNAAGAAAGAAGGKPLAGPGYDPAAGPPPEVAQALGRMFLLYPVVILGAFVASGVLMGAVFRAVLEPEDSSFAYLRLGMRELWLVLVNFVMRFIIAFASLPILMVFMIVAGITGVMTAVATQSAQGPPQFPMILIPIWAVAMLGFVAVQIWLGMRLVMGLPMSFDQNQFRLFESWGFTRGHTWKLVGLLLLLVAIGIVIELVVIGVCVGVVAAVAGSAGLTSPQNLEALFRQPPATWAMGAIAAAGLGSLLIALVAGFANAIFLAPWAEAYRQLRDSGASPTPQYVPHVGEARPIA